MFTFSQLFYDSTSSTSRDRVNMISGSHLAIRVIWQWTPIGEIYCYSPRPCKDNITEMHCLVGQFRRCMKWSLRDGFVVGTDAISPISVNGIPTGESALESMLKFSLLRYCRNTMLAVSGHNSFPRVPEKRSLFPSIVEKASNYQTIFFVYLRDWQQLPVKEYGRLSTF